MFDPRTLYVRAGDLVLPAWHKLLEALRSFQLYGGRGILLSKSSLGTVVNVREQVVGFVGAWDVQRKGSVVTVGLGLVNGLEPLINGIPITGNEKEGKPSLKLRLDRFDKTGRSWISLRVKIDPETGRIIQPDEKGEGELELTIEQRDNLLRADPDDSTIGFKAIAMLKRAVDDDSTFGDLHQALWFDQQHRTVKQNEKWRHFFDPA